MLCTEHQMAIPPYVNLTFQRVVGQLEVEKDGHTEISDYPTHAAFGGCFIKGLLINWSYTVGSEWKGEYEHLSFSPVLLWGEQYGPFLFFFQGTEYLSVLLLSHDGHVVLKPSLLNGY